MVNIRRIRRLYCMLALGFLLGVRDGYIALWQEGTPEPLRVFPYAATSLPEADRAALEQGILIENSALLTKYLEDFLS